LGLGFSNVALGAEQPDVWEHFRTKSDLLDTHDGAAESPDNEATTPEVKVSLIDDQTLLRAQLARLLASKARIRVIDQTTDRARIGHMASDLLPGVLLVDLNKPADAVRRLSLDSSTVEILVVVSDLGNGGFETAAQNLDAEEVGGEYSGVLARIKSAGELTTDIDVPRRPDVSNRELVVLAQVAAGLSNKQIGRLLGISQKTVRNHLSRIFGKLGAGNRTEAVMNAMRLGLLTV
jgi:DNA-binding NarL/FixJ family response regulator